MSGKKKEQTKSSGKQSSNSKRNNVFGAKHPWRNFGVLAMLIIVFAIIWYHSADISRYELVEFYPDSATAYGYEVADNTQFTLTEEEEHYVDYAYSKQKLRCLCLQFENVLEENLPLVIETYDGEEKVDTLNYTVAEGTDYAQIYLGVKSPGNLLRVHTENNFNLTGVSFQGLREPLEKEPVGKLYIGVLFLLVLLAVPGALSVRVEQVLEKMAVGCREKAGDLAFHYKQILFSLLYLVLAAAVGIGISELWRKFYQHLPFALNVNIILFGSMLGMLLYLILFYFIRKDTNFDRLYVRCGFLLVVAMSLLLPLKLHLSWDDQTHYVNAVEGSRLHSAYYSLAEDNFYNTCFNWQLYGFEAGDKPRFNRIMNDSQAIHTSVGVPVGISTYKLLVYLPVSLMLFLLRGLSVPLTVSVVLGRMAGACFYVYMLYRGMRHLKAGKQIMAALSLIPGLIFLVSNYNYDYWVIALVGYSMAYLIGEYQEPDKPMTRKDIILIYGSFLIGILIKPVYIPMLGLAAFLPKEKFSSDRFRRIYRVCFGAIVVCAVIGFAVMIFGGGLGSGDARGGEEVDAAGQIQFILANPKQYTNILLNYLRTYLSRVSVDSYFASMAYLGNDTWLGHIVLIWITVVAVFDRDLAASRKVSWPVKVCALPLAFVTVCCVATSMYVVFTAVGSETIEGCQGRYLYPVMLPLYLALTQIRFIPVTYSERVKRIVESVAMLGTIILASLMLVKCV